LATLLAACVLADVVCNGTLVGDSFDVGCDCDTSADVIDFCAVGDVAATSMPGCGDVFGGGELVTAMFDGRCCWATLEILVTGDVICDDDVIATVCAAGAMTGCGGVTTVVGGLPGLG